MGKKDVDAAVKWYKDNRSLYESLAHKVEQIIKENLDQKAIVYHSVTSRPKSLKSFADKAAKDKYSDPKTQIKDMAGVRVITYLESDVQKVASVIQPLFSIDSENSVDQSRLLGSDRVGYRSVHYVAELDGARCGLPEYKRYADLPFEIQIRSLLQHAWAEIEHDRNYKFSGKLPSQLERRFYLVAGILEVADREFVEIASGIDRYKADVIEEIGKNELDIEINSLSLKEYLSRRFSKATSAGILTPNFGGPDDTLSKDIVEELRSFGVSKLHELDRMVPTDLQDYMIRNKKDTNFAGLVRDILIISDAKKYFEVSWQNHWTAYEEDSREVYDAYKVDMQVLDEYVEPVSRDDY
jgi:ppGpp synthetase/RelA/SpoT-type nucleotidyltranferase